MSSDHALGVRARGSRILKLLALEPRFLMDAALTETVAETTPGDGGDVLAQWAENPAPALEASLPDPPHRQLVIIDPTVEGYAALLQGVGDNAEIMILDPSRDGIQQISDLLSVCGTSYDALHLVSHGESGSLRLGTGILDGGSLDDYAAQLQGWSNYLNVDADILIYGCNVAQGEEGLGFIKELSRLTGADVAGSDDLTGGVDRGGDWNLEQATGIIDVAAPFSDQAMAAWGGILDGVTQEDKVVASDGAASDSLGVSVDIDGNRAISGAPLDDGGAGTDQGAAYIFTWDGSNWTEQQKLTPSDAAASDNFGQSVAIDGDWAVVSSHWDDDGASSAGSAYVFQWNGASWVQFQKLTAGDFALNDQFGYSVAVDGNTLVVGAWLDDDMGTNSGSAYVYNWNGSTWAYQQKLTAGDGVANAYFGSSVSADGSRIMVGAYGDSQNGSGSGSAYIFNWNGASWAQQGKVVASDGVAGDNFGASVSISGDTAVAGVQFADVTDTDSGAAYVYNWNGSAWVQQQKLSTADGVNNDRFGYSVAAEGQTVVVGTVNDPSGAWAAGSLFVYQWNGSSWNLEQEVLASDPEGNDGMGASVAMSGDTIITGARYEDDAASGAGAAYFFDVNFAPVLDTSSTHSFPPVTQGNQSNPGSTVYEMMGGAVLDPNQEDQPGIAVTYVSTSNGTWQYSIDGGASWSNFGAVSDSAATLLVAQASIRFVPNPDFAGTANLSFRAWDTTDGSANGSTGVDVSVNGGTTAFSASTAGASIAVIPAFGEEKVLAGDGAASDAFASSVAVSGSTAIVGAYLANIGGNVDTGVAYTYAWNGSSWTQQQKLTASDYTPSDAFGVSVSISGNTAIVGASGNDDGGTDSGSAYIFQWNGSSWVEQQKLTASDAGSGDEFGCAVAISGNTAIIGARYDDDGGTDAGAAYIFQWDGASWVQQQKITSGDVAAGDLFGSAVAISGGTAIVGASDDDDAGSLSGSAYVFQWAGSSWTQQAKLTASDAEAGDLFGVSVALADNTAVIGARYDDDGGTNAGAAYLFQWNGSSWVQQQKITASDIASGDYFGGAVAISGDKVVVSSYGNDDAGVESGSSYLFQWNGSSWVQTQKFVASDAAASDYFGNAVAISGDAVLVGASFEDASGADSGSAYFYQLNSAPVLDNSGAPTLTAVNEDDASPAGTLVSDFLGGSVTDGYAGLQGIAVTAVDESNGTWQYTTDGGSNWYGFDGVSGSVAYQLYADANTRLRFIPSADYVGSATITYRAWDGTSGFAANPANTANNGGMTSFSIASETATVTVNNVNDAPLLNTSGAPFLAPVTQSNADPAGTRIIELLATSFSDIDDNSEDGIAVTAADTANGSWQYSTDDGESWNTIGAVSDSNAKLLDAGSLLRFVPNLDFSGSATISYRAWDQAAGSAETYVDVSVNGGTTAFSTATETATVYVIPAGGEQKVTASDAAAGDYFGGKVVVNGDVAIIGASMKDVVGTDSGAAYVYRFDGSSWVEEQRLTPSDAAIEDMFGVSVDIQGDWAVVGAWGETFYTGAAYLFRWNGSSWVEAQKLTASDAATSDQYGIAVDLCGDTLLVGANYGNGVTANTGSAYLYRYNGATWSEEAELYASDGVNSANFGNTLVLGDDIALISAYTDNSSTGAVYVFGYDGSSWSQIQKLTASDGAASDLFGLGLALFGDTAVIGAYGDDDLGSNSGSAYVFNWNGTSWVETQKLTASDGVANDRFTGSCGIDLDGDTLLIGSYQDDDGAGDAGSVYLFRYEGGSWVEQEKFIASDPGATDWFGYDVSLDGNTALVSGIWNDDNGSNSGSAYFYQLNSAPVLDNSGDPIIVTMDEDVGLPSGVLISDYMDASDVDPLFGSPGIAVTGLDSNNGYWEYSLDGGSSWLSFGTPADSAATLLAATARVRFTPNADWNGSANFTYRTWDRTSGVSGTSGVDTSTANGGMYAFSSTSETAIALVNPVNDAPVLDNSGSPTLTSILTASNGGSGTLITTLVAGLISDADNGGVGPAAAGEGTSEGIAVTGLDTSNGSWQYSLDGGASWVNFGAVSDAGATLLSSTARVRFVPNLAFSGTASMTFRAWDQAQGTNGQASVNVGSGGGSSPFSTASETATISVVDGQGQKMTASDKADYDYLGISVAVDGNWAIMGAYGADMGGSERGAAYLYQWNGSGWVEFQKIGASDGANDDYFGYSVAIDGNWALVGTPGVDNGGQTDAGAAYLFQFNGSTWVEQQKLMAGTTFDQFGGSVAIDGTTAIIGATYDDSGGSDSGAAYVYTFNGSTWGQVQKFTASDIAGGDAFGENIAISGNTVVVSARSDDDKGSDSGSAYVFQWNGSSLVQQQKLTASDGEANDAFGSSLSVSGNTIAVGASNDDDRGADAGAAYLFQWNGSSWVQQQKVTASDGAAGDLFGYGVSVENGLLLVGAPSDDDQGADSGSAYLFQYANGSWVQVKKIVDVGGAANDYFGTRVSLDDGKVLVGAYMDDNSTDTGSTTVLRLNNAPVVSGTAQGITASGSLVSSFANGVISDVDAGALKGIAVTGLDSANGTWQYSLDGGSSWNTFGSVSDTSATLLADSASVRFLANAGFSGSANVTFRAWDRTLGGNGQSGVNAGGYAGGLYPFSAASGSTAAAVQPATTTTSSTNNADPYNNPQVFKDPVKNDPKKDDSGPQSTSTIGGVGNGGTPIMDTVATYEAGFSAGDGSGDGTGSGAPDADSGGSGPGEGEPGPGEGEPGPGEGEPGPDEGEPADGEGEPVPGEGEGEPAPEDGEGGGDLEPEDGEEGGGGPKGKQAGGKGAGGGKPGLSDQLAAQSIPLSMMESVNALLAQVSKVVQCSP